jgi:hypothetical protein
MLRRVLIASAAAAMLLVTTFHSDDAFARGGRGGGFHGGGMRAGGFHGALSVCAAGAWPVATAAIGVPTVQGPIAATVLAPIAATATASVQRRWAPLRSAPRGGGLLRRRLRLRHLRQLGLPERVSVLSGTRPLAYGARSR